MANKRRWYQTRRFRGAVFGVTGAALLTIPGAPIVATAWGIAITTQTVGVILSGIGTYVFGYGQGRAVERGEKKPDDGTTRTN